MNKQVTVEELFTVSRQLLTVNSFTGGKTQ